MATVRSKKTWGLRVTEPAPPQSEVVPRASAPDAAAPETQEGLAPGDVVANRYLLTSMLGVGGMGAIWLARDLRLDIDVALKFIQRELASEQSAERLLQEARAVARLDHPSIVRVFDFGESETGEPFMAMEVLRGELLTEVLSRKGRLAAPNAICMLLPIASAVAAAHAKGIVHRDLKPDNILLVTDQASGAVVPKVLDFGIAQLRTRNKARRVTESGAIVGTPDYMPPEQASGRGEVDPRADVWSFCVVLYEAITGRLPFDAETATLVLIAIVSAAPTPTTELAAGDEALWKIIERGLQKDPDDRYQTMRDLGQALARWARENGAETDVAGTSIAVHWLAERARRPLSDIPRAPEPSPTGDVAAEAPSNPTLDQAGAPAAADANEPPRSGATWPPRPL
ncbi:MAG TPA: serine/threonine-protein kinase, partial [Minicystis sp.]|nr:serine/threonine-protein kinase [Minicystis sp.]